MNQILFIDKRHPKNAFPNNIEAINIKSFRTTTIKSKIQSTRPKIKIIYLLILQDRINNFFHMRKKEENEIKDMYNKINGYKRKISLSPFSFHSFCNAERRESFYSPVFKGNKAFCTLLPNS